MSDQQKRKYWFAKHKILTIILVLVVLAVIGAATGGNKNSSSNNSTSSSTNSTTPKTTSSPTTAKVGEAVRDGKFEFTVNSIKCGIPSVGQDYSTKTAQGQYCELDISVKNIGNEAQTLSSSDQYLYNAQGQKYSADDTATYTAAPSGSTWYNDINPGNSVEGVVVFDIPKDQTPTTAELHDSSLSNGIKVSLN